MNSKELQSRMTKLLAILGDLSNVEALQALNQVSAEILRSVEATDASAFNVPVIAVPAHLLERRRGRPSKIESDPKLRDFIHELEPGLTIKEIEARCVAMFGEERAPRKSTISRYIQRMRKYDSRRTEIRDE